MGQKVHPEAMRVGYIHDWKSNWFNEKNFAEYLDEDIRIRAHIVRKLAHAGLSDITIRKDANELEVNIHTARPGIVIGKSGSEVDALRRDLHRMTNKPITLNISEIKRPELDAKLVAQSIAEQLQNRVGFRRAMKRSLASAIRSGAAGVKVQCSGRLGGSEMSRSEQYSEGRVPLHTIRADIDYGFVEAKTPTGRIGVKVWINKGEIMPQGYSGMAEKKETRLGDQDTARRRGGGAGNRPGAPRTRGGATQRPAGGTSGGGRARTQDAKTPDPNVEQPTTDQSVVEATVEATPAPVVDAPVVETPATEVKDVAVKEAAAKEKAPKAAAPKAAAPKAAAPKAAAPKAAAPKDTAPKEAKPKAAPRKKK